MVIDLKLWRQDKIGDKVREFKINYPEKTVTNDQCALNGVLYNSWTRLPLFGINNLAYTARAHSKTTLRLKN